MTRFSVATAALVLMLTAAVGRAEMPRDLFLQMPAPALAGNVLGSPERQPVFVHLPPSYHDTEAAYPVVYFLHGFGGDAWSLSRIGPMLDAAMVAGDCPEFVLVCPNGRNELQGSFYADSPVTGRWATFIVQDVVGWTDRTLRTERESGRRVLAGFSMGGSGALFLGLEHPDIFGAVWSLSPGLYAPAGLETALPGWTPIFLRAYGATFAGDPAAAWPHARIPGAEPRDPEIMAAWERGFGDLDRRLDRYLAGRVRLTALAVEFGSADPYPWIPDGCRHLAELAGARGVPLALHDHDGGHDLGRAQLEERLLPFVARVLDD